MFVYGGKTNLFDHNYPKELSTLIHQSYENGNKSSYITNFSYKLDKFLNQNRISDIFDTINSIFSLIVSIFYIISTYTHPERTQTHKRTNYYLDIIETIFLIYFIIHYFLRFYCSQNRIIYILELFNLVDIASSICLILSKQEFAKHSSAGYYLRCVRMVRIYYLFKMENILQRRTNEQIRYLYKLALTLIAIIFISSSIILELENDYTRKEIGTKEYSSDKAIYQFHDILYFEAVTLTTIGFGDITPKSDLGRLAVIITVGIVIAVLPALFSKISIVFSLNSKFSRKKYTKSSKKPKHLVLVGDCGPESFDACLQELYHEDHANTDFDTVILQIKPNEEMLKIFQRKSYTNNVYYLVGNVSNHKDLYRARTDNSICVIILANKLTTNHRQEDFNNIMKAFSILKYSNMVCGEPKTRVCIQLILPETKEIFYNSLLQKNEYEKGPQIICVEEIKLELLGKSCLCQGINAIIAALTTSQKPSINEIREIPYFQEWMKEYLEGLENEIYCIKIRCEYLHNLTFNDLVKIIYELTDFIVIGTDVIHQELKPFVCLNPFNYNFSPFDHLIYLIASRQPNESEINDLLEKYLENQKKGIIENNIEMVKIKRLKKTYWANLGRDFEQKKRFWDELEEEENKLKFENINPYINNNLYNNLKEENEFQDLLYLNDNINKNQDPRIYNKYAFISTLRPRTQHESEYFSIEILEKHIIICGINPNLKYLILPLRTSGKMKHHPILIMDKNEHLSTELWKELQYFPDIYYMQGNPIKSDDLKKAKVSKAQAVVILSKYNQENQLLEMVDADSIFIYKAIKNESNDTLIIADLVSSNSIGYITNSGDENMDNFGFWLNEAFASGELYISSMLDTLICQAFYNPYILNIIYQLMLGESSFKFPEKTLNRLNKYKYIKSSLNLYKIKELLEKYRFNQEMPSSKKITFKIIFEFLVEKCMIPIGILRAPTNYISQKYIFLAPYKDTIINTEKDEIYVISSDEELDIEEQKKNFDQYSMNLIEKSNTVFSEMKELTKKTVDEIINNLREQFNVKNIINSTRNSLRNEFHLAYQRKEEEIAKLAKEEFNKENMKIKEDSGIIEIDESESKSSNSKS